MKKKSRKPDQFPAVNVFAHITYDTHIKLSTLAATLGVGRLELYRQALTWAINQEQFIVDMAKVYKGNEALGAE